MVSLTLASGARPREVGALGWAEPIVGPLTDETERKARLNDLIGGAFCQASWTVGEGGINDRDPPSSRQPV